jgi:hypothetical protein
MGWMQPSEPSKTIVFTMNFNDFTTRRPSGPTRRTSGPNVNISHQFSGPSLYPFFFFLVPFWGPCLVRVRDLGTIFSSMGVNTFWTGFVYVFWRPPSSENIVLPWKDYYFHQITISI